MSINPEDAVSIPVDYTFDIDVPQNINSGTLCESSDKSTINEKTNRARSDSGCFRPRDVINREENEDYRANVMTSSYTEISFEESQVKKTRSCDTGRANKVKSVLEATHSNDDREGSSCIRERQRPSSLILTSNSENVLLPLETDCQSQSELESNAFSWTRVTRGQQTSDSQVSIDGSPSISSEEFLNMGHRRADSDTSGLFELPGTLILEGDVMTFVADDLQEKIRLSSPLSRKDTPSFPSSRVSTPSLYKQALQPHVPLVDAGALADLEAHATRVASGVHTMLENLSGTVQSISSLTVDCMETYEKSVCKTCDTVDSNIKSMYQLMAKCEELSNTMKPIYKVSEEIKEIKRLLDLFENIVEQKS